MRIIAIATSLLIGCGDGGADHLLGEPSGGPGAEVGGDGVDTGGAQDIAAAREAIGAGKVPDAQLITVEGLLSEHDVPTSGAPCNSPICVRPATGIAPSLETGQLERWVHIGMTTGIDLATWQRPPIDLVIAIDKSGSMAGDMVETTDAAARLIGQTGDNDRVGVIAFDSSVQWVHPFGAVADRDALQTSVRALGAYGDWDINRALDAAYAALGTATPGRIRRVVVMSCGYPYVSPDFTDRTSVQVQARGAEGIGITFVGVLLGYSGPLAALLGESNGANYYYINSLESIPTVFDTDAAFMLTPIAYDLALGLQLSSGWKLDRMYGIPGNADGTPADGYTVATAFFSRRRGSIVARLSWTGNGAAPPAAASVSLSYRPEQALGWTEATSETIDAMTGAPAPDGTYYGTGGVRKAVMLVNMAVRMIEACTKWHANSHDEARAIVGELETYLVDAQTALGDPALDAEIELVSKLLANMGG